MKYEIPQIKGIHPGFILAEELKRRHLKKGQFALSVSEFPQTLVAITKGKRRMNIHLALKIEKALGFEEGFLMILQTYHDIEVEKNKQVSEKPNLSILRSALFWDTKIERINWEKQKKAVINRVFERGNTEEKAEISRFYGEKTVKIILNEKAKQT